MSGDINADAGIIRYASRLKWKNVPIRSILESSFHIPVFIEENVRLLSFAEKCYGAGREYNNIVCLRIGDDIGAGIIVNGMLYPGSVGKETLQSLASSDAILRRANELKKDDSFINTKDIAIAASKGDVSCMQAMDETGRYIAEAIFNLITCVDPELVIIGGGLARSGELLLDPIKKYLEPVLKEYNTNTKITLAKLGEEAFSLGAATYVMQKIFSAPKDYKKPVKKFD